VTEKAVDMESDLRARVVALENWRVQRDIESARNDEKWSAMEHRIDTRFTGLERSVLDIQTSLSRINWLIIGGIISGVIAFVMQGGFSPS
jgi:hypothetical protein